MTLPDRNRRRLKMQQVVLHRVHGQQVLDRIGPQNRLEVLGKDQEEIEEIAQSAAEEEFFDSIFGR